MRFRRLTLLLLLTAFGEFALESSHARVKKRDEPWDIFNDPLLWMKDPIVDLKKLPTSGQSKIKLYSGHAWSQYRGGFAWRPRTPMDKPRSEDIDYRIYKKEEVLNLPKNQLATLSPAEKLSLINCDYDFNLVTAERALNEEVMAGARETVKEKEKSKSKIKSGDIQYGTAGFCHLVSELPIYFEEPKDGSIKACDGLEIPVTSSDLKAMAMMSLRKSFNTRKHDMLGRQCKDAKKPDEFCASCAEDAVKKSNRDEETKKELIEKLQKYYWSKKQQELDYVTTHNCSDTNPGSLHVLMGNILGKGQRPIIMDRDQDATIWNRAIRSYKSYELKPRKGQTLKRREPSKNAAEGTTVEIPMEMEIDFIVNVGSDQVQSTVSEKKKVRYYLEVRENKNTGEDEILGGSWITKDHPDLFWMPNNPASETGSLLSGEFEKLKGLLKTRSNEELK